MSSSKSATPAAVFSGRKITLLGLVASTYFMVAGGPYALEDVVRTAGYFGAVMVLLVVPLLWSLPTGLMVSELASTLPEAGGYYVWVRRALGPFWGFQEAWLSLVASIFDMAIYPILFVTYLGYVGQYALPGLGGPDFWEVLRKPHPGLAGFLIGTAMIVACTLLNLRSAGSVGLSAVLLTVVMLSPFVVLSVLAVAQPPLAAGGDEPRGQPSVEALLFALWNYMGWDNAATVGNEVERPQQTYPLGIACAVVLVALTYVLPVLAVAHTGIDPAEWDTGTWVTVGERVGGTVLALALGVGGMISAFGMFSSLVLSYSRLPVVLAEDGYLPRAFTRRLSNGVPWVAVLVCAVAWALASQLGLKRVLALDVILYGLALLLEFAALVALRLYEPQLVRPFRVPGGLTVAVLLGLFPALLLAVAVFDQAGQWRTEADDLISPAVALWLGVALAGLGPLCYFLARFLWGADSAARMRAYFLPRHPKENNP